MNSVNEQFGSVQEFPFKSTAVADEFAAWEDDTHGRHGDYTPAEEDGMYAQWLAGSVARSLKRPATPAQASVAIAEIDRLIEHLDARRDEVRKIVTRAKANRLLETVAC